MARTNDPYEFPSTPAEPCITRRDARRLGYPRREYATVRAAFHAAMAAHRAAHPTGDDARYPEPRPIDDQQLMRDPVGRASTAIETSCARLLDRELDHGQGLLAGATADVGALERWDDRTITTSEDRTRYLLREARVEVGVIDELVERDRVRGARHHERVSRFLHRLPAWLLVPDIAAMTVMLGTVLNVDLLHPGQDPYGDVTVAFIAIAAPLTQYQVTKRAADDTNEWRQARAEGRRHAADRARRRMLALLVAVLGINAALVAFLVYRVWVVADGGQALGAMGLAILIAFTIVAGAAAPVLKFLAVARDGSTYSRRRDELNRRLDDLEHERLEMLERASGALVELEALTREYRFAHRRSVLDAALAALLPGHRRLQLLRLMLGQDAVDLQTPTEDATVVTPGVAAVAGPNHAPLLARDARLASLVEAAIEVRYRLARVQPSRELEPGG